LNYYLFNNLIKDKNLITTGKLNKIDINLLLNYKIALPPLKIQKNVASYYDINNQLIEENQNQINLYNQIINKLINIVYSNVEKIPLQQICKITTSPNNDTFINVNKNSSLAGNINLHTKENPENTNFYYISDVKDFDKKCLYYLLKNEENSLHKLASLTQNINLSRKNLESFEIRNLSEKSQKRIVEECDKYSNMIDSLIKANEHLKNINIFDVLISID
jgi:restriction endonuclease S subunit